MEQQYKCPWCDVTKHLRGLACHVGRSHKLSSEHLHRELFHDGKTPLCKCGCGQQVKWLQRAFGEYLRGHNGFSQLARDEAAEARRKMASRGELTSWNKGLTKESDERVANYAKKISESIDGTEISRKLASRPAASKEKHRRNLADSIKKTFAAGRTVWNKGKTKSDDESIAKAGASISQIRLSGFVPNRFTEDDIRELVSKTEVFDVVEPISYQNKYGKFHVRCKTCGEVSVKNVLMLRATPTCFKCFPKESLGQRELYDFVRKLTPDATLSERGLTNVSEVDVYVPSRRFALEYNGLYWHSTAVNKDPNYHQRKSDACRASGIDLFHVYADDWHNKRSIVESMIKHRLGMSAARIYARQCTVAEVSPDKRKEFLEGCHLDGDVPSSIAFGLEKDGELVAVLSLRKPFHKKWSSHVEVARFATKNDTAVVGGLSRLTKAAANWASNKGYVGLLSYADGRIGEGSGYASAGFTKVGATTPSFWWTDFASRYNRFKYRANKELGITEQQAAEAAGVVRIYGCCNSIMVKLVEGVSFS